MRGRLAQQLSLNGAAALLLSFSLHLWSLKVFSKSGNRVRSELRACGSRRDLSPFHTTLNRSLAASPESHSACARRIKNPSATTFLSTRITLFKADHCGSNTNFMIPIFFGWAVNLIAYKASFEAGYNLYFRAVE